MCRRERNGNRSPGDLLLKGRVGERAVGFVSEDGSASAVF